MLDQSRFQLLSGSSALACLDVADFETVRSITEQRLLNSLCLEETPDDILWDQLLSDALAVSVVVQQDQGIASESMRNYSYQLKEYANSWELLSRKSGDLLAKFNACPSGISFQTDLASRIYGSEYRECV